RAAVDGDGPGRGVAGGQARMKPTILYDGHCRFCIEQMERLARWLPPGKYQALNFQEPGVLEQFPGVTHAQAMRALQFVDAPGRVYSGAEAAVRALGLRPLFKVAYVYYLPGLRQILDAVYRAVARNRYRIAGKTCEEGTCALHAGEATRASRSSPAESSRTQ